MSNSTTIDIINKIEDFLNLSSKDKILMYYPNAELVLWWDQYKIVFEPTAHAASRAGNSGLEGPCCVTIAEAWDEAWIVHGGHILSRFNEELIGA